MILSLLWIFLLPLKRQIGSFVAFKKADWFFSFIATSVVPAPLPHPALILSVNSILELPDVLLQALVQLLHILDDFLVVRMFPIFKGLTGSR